MTALLINHVQTKINKNVYEYDKMIKNINNLISFFNYTKQNIYVSEIIPHKIGHTTNDLKNLNYTKCYYSNLYSSYNYKFVNELKVKNINKIVLTGVETQWCITQTATSFTQKNTKVYLPIDSVSSHSKFEHEEAIKHLRSIGVHICTTKSFLNSQLIYINSPESKWYMKNIIQQDKHT